MQRSPSFNVGAINTFPPVKLSSLVGALRTDGHVDRVALLENDIASAESGDRIDSLVINQIHDSNIAMDGFVVIRSSILLLSLDSQFAM